MKVLNISSLVTLLSVTLLTVGCQSVSNDVTPATTPAPVIGQKGVSARINNQTWQSATEQTTTDKAYYAVRGGANANELTVIGFGAFAGVANATKTDRITLFLSSVSGIGTYPLSSRSQATYTGTAGELTNYVTDASRTGAVTITKYDLTNGLVSGTFTFSAVGGSAVVAVTEGQFTDVQFGK